MAAVANCSAQDAAQHVVAAVVAGLDAVGDGEREGAEVVGNHPEGDGILHLLAEGRAIGVELGVDVDVGLAAEFFQLLESGREDVGGVVGGLVGEIGEALGVLNNGAGTLETHAGVHVFGGQFAKRAVGFGVVLDEHEVPDLDAEIRIHIDQLALGIAVGAEVDVELGAGTAGAGLAHHPEVVLHVAIDDLHLGIATGFGEEFGPEIVGLLIELTGVAVPGGVDRGVETLGGEAPALDHQLPCPGDGFPLEVVAKGPVAQHLKEGVVVGVVADIL